MKAATEKKSVDKVRLHEEHFVNWAINLFRIHKAGCKMLLCLGTQKDSLIIRSENKSLMRWACQSRREQHESGRFVNPLDIKLAGNANQ